MQKIKNEAAEVSTLLFSTDEITEFHETSGIPSLNLDALLVLTRYRGHPQLNRADQQNLFRYELASAIQSGGICVTHSKGNKIIAACAIKPLSWDTQHFGILMAKLTVAAAPDCLPATLRAMVNDALHAVKKRSTKLHISSEVDIDDYLCLNTLLNFGAEILDIKREYRWTSAKGITPPKFLSRIRKYQTDDKKQVIQLLKKSHFESRFSRDYFLDQNKTVELYQIWLEKLLDGDERDKIALVLERDGRIQACGTIEKHDLSYAGVDLQLMNNGIYVSSPDATGAYYPMIYSLTKCASIYCKSSQTCISLNNHSAQRVLEKMNLGTASTRYALRLLI